MKQDNEKYCSECGSIINIRAEPIKKAAPEKTAFFI